MLCFFFTDHPEPKGRRAVKMLTLRELKQMVEPVDERRRVPTLRAQMESGVPIVVKERLNEQTELIVFANGYVSYRSGRRMTVFPLHSCRGYHYEMFCGGVQFIPEEFFDREAWHIRLMLEGEDRLAKNLDVKENRNQVSYSAVSEDWAVLVDAKNNLAEQVVEQEMVEEMLSVLTEKQRAVVIRYYIKEENHREIAADLGISRQAVTDMIAKAIRRIRVQYGITDKHIKGMPVPGK